LKKANTKKTKKRNFSREKMNVGGRYSVRDVSEEAQEILENARPQIEAKLGYRLEILKALQSIAAGANYFIKVNNLNLR
jgi:hypothetical protein